MRLWSIHPKYLDTKGLIALWREALLAKCVLEGKTNGYKNHPQLERFKEARNPIDSINYYLSEIYNEAKRCGYKFDKSKINWDFSKPKLNVTNGQIEYEKQHLLNKLIKRDKNKYLDLSNILEIECHPQFIVVTGDIAKWEKNQSA